MLFSPCRTKGSSRLLRMSPALALDLEASIILSAKNDCDQNPKGRTPVQLMPIALEAHGVAHHYMTLRVSRSIG